MPAQGPQFGLPELGPTLGMLGLFLLAYGVFAQMFPMVSPRLAMVTLELESHHGGSAFDHEEATGDYATEAATRRVVVLST